jgi:hypothetical protein
VKSEKLFFFLFLIIVLCGCGSYQEGRQDGSAGRGKISFASDEYLKGYNEGKEEAYFYQLGYRDGSVGRPPNSEMEHRLMYRQGYKEAGGLLH